MMPDVAIEKLSLALGAFRLREVTLTIEEGEILALLGPNGAGKSVTLETIAGFHRPLSGRIAIHGRDAAPLPPERRNIGLIFQNYSLFPHLTVAQNIAFGFRARRLAKRKGETPFSRLDLAGLLDYFGIEPLAARAPTGLSPGESQRVALARAFAAAPDLFLFDEPFSALDAQTRATLRGDLGRFLREARVPAIFVTHNHEDVAALGDKIAVMRAGAIIQSGSAAAIFRTPADIFVADFIGIENIVAGEIVASAADHSLVRVGPAMIRATASPCAIGTKIHLCLRAADVELYPLEAAPSGAGTNLLPARIKEVTEQPLLYKVTLDCGFDLVTYLTAREMRRLGVAGGGKVAIGFAPGATHLIA